MLISVGHWNKRDAISAISLAAATCVAETLGGGLVGLPYVVVQTRIVFGGVMIVFGVLLTYYTAWLLSELYLDILSVNNNQLASENEYDHDDTELLQLSEHQKQQQVHQFGPHADNNDNNSTESNQSISPYLAIAKHIWPNYGEYLIGFCVVVTLTFADVVFLVLSGMNLRSIVGFRLSQTVCIIIFAFISLILSYLWREVNHYKYFVWFALLSTFIAIILSFPTAIIHHPTSPPASIPSLESRTVFDYAEAYGTIMFAFGGHSAFPTYQQNMGLQYRHLFKYSIIIAYVYMLLMMLPFSVLLGILYGETVNENICNSFPHNNIISIIIIILITCHMISAIGTLVPPVAAIVSKIISNNTKIYWWSPIVVQVIAVIIAISLQETFLIVMGTVGNTTIAAATFVFPCLLYVIHFKDKISIYSKIICWIFVVVGIFNAICAVSVTVYKILS